MIRVVISDRHGGSLPGRPRADGKRSAVPLNKGRNEIDQLDLDVALAVPQVAALFAKGGPLHLEPVAAVEQPPVPAAVPVVPAQRAGRSASMRFSEAKK